MIDEEIDNILEKPVATRDDIEQLAYWCLDLCDVNKRIADENQALIDTIVRLKKDLEWYRKMTAIQVHHTP